jgi:predicted fused transcriptional regulator/phosphomethylpyrimidine kinase
VKRRLVDPQTEAERRVCDRSDEQLRIAELENFLALKNQQLQAHVICANRFAEQVAELEGQVTRIVGIVQTFQPAGSPPPGDAEILVRWICNAMRTERDAAQAQVAALGEALQEIAGRETYEEMESASRPDTNMIIGTGEDAIRIARAALTHDVSALVDAARNGREAVKLLPQAANAIESLIACATDGYFDGVWHGDLFAKLRPLREALRAAMTASLDTKETS